MKINVGFLMSYDYELLKISIPLIYKGANSIVLALDKDRLTWSGNKFTVEDSFFDWLRQIDSEKKIELYEDAFYQSHLTPMQSDNYQRNKLAEVMGDGVCLQIDADEYFLDFDGFVAYLKKHKFYKNTKVQICPYLIPIYKVLEDGVLYVPKLSAYYIGANKPNFIRARKAKGKIKWYVPYISIHQSWGRSEEELKFKLENWGHRDDFDSEAYFKLWKSINKGNYKDFKNVHPLDPKEWSSLEFCAGSTMDEVIENLRKIEKAPRIKRQVKNFFQRIKL